MSESKVDDDLSISAAVFLKYWYQYCKIISTHLVDKVLYIHTLRIGIFHHQVQVLLFTFCPAEGSSSLICLFAYISYFLKSLHVTAGISGSLHQSGPVMKNKVMNHFTAPCALTVTCYIKKKSILFSTHKTCNYCYIGLC